MRAILACILVLALGVACAPPKSKKYGTGNSPAGQDQATNLGPIKHQGSEAHGGDARDANLTAEEIKEYAVQLDDLVLQYLDRVDLGGLYTDAKDFTHHQEVAAILRDMLNRGLRDDLLYKNYEVTLDKSCYVDQQNHSSDECIEENGKIRCSASAQRDDSQKMLFCLDPAMLSSAETTLSSFVGLIFHELTHTYDYKDDHPVLSAGTLRLAITQNYSSVRARDAFAGKEYKERIKIIEEFTNPNL